MPTSRRALLIALILGCLTATGCTAVQSVGGGGPAAADEGGNEVVLARAPWRTGHMQAEIYRQLMTELGYEVVDPADMEGTPAEIYPRIARGDVDLWANGWFPLHEPYLERTQVTGQRRTRTMRPVGLQVAAGALQGYLVDAATARRLDVTSTADLARPEVAAAFDADGDGTADLIGCDEGWGCHEVIDRHLAAFEWGSNVTHRFGDYDDLASDVVERIDAGEPALFYAWTPHWTSGALVPGDNVVWLESSPLPGEAGASVDGLVGCATGGDSCALGWPVNDIRAVANDTFLENEPQVAALLEVIEIPLADISDQNARMYRAQGYDDGAVTEDAAAWIADNREAVDRWLQHAREQDG